MFLAIILFRLVLTLETSEMSTIFVFTISWAHFFTTKATQPRPQVFSVNGALTCKKAPLLTSSVHKTQNSSKFWSSVAGYGELCVLLANHNRGNILNQ